MDKLVRPSAKIRVFLGVDFSRIKNIIFDLGDVIINIDPTKTYAAFARLTDQPLDQTLERFNELQVFQRYERGEFTDTEFIQFLDRKSTRLNSSHKDTSRMPSSA